MKYLSLFLMLAIPFAGTAQENKWTPEEIINTVYVGSPEFSKDGQKVVWSQRKGLKKEDKFVNQLYMARLNNEAGKPKVVQLTRSKSSESNPVFSADGESLYFLSSREKGKKLWKLNLYGGEPEEVHTFENGISSVKRLDAGTLLFISEEGKTLYDISNEKDNTNIVEDTLHWNPRRIYSFDLKSKEINRITENAYRINNYEVSEDGQYLVYQEITTPDYGVDGNPKPNYVLVNLKEKSSTKILSGLQSPTAYRFTKDGKGFYFSAETSSDPEWNGSGIRELYYYTFSTGNYTKVPLEWENGLSGEYFLNGNGLIVQLANGPLRKVRYYEKKNSDWSWKDISLGDQQEHVSVMAFNPASGKILYRHSTASKLPEYYLAKIKVGRKSISLEGSKTLTSLNDKLKKKPIAKSEIIYWKGANDEEVNGILYYPKNYVAGKKYPLVLSIHGGPTGVDQDRWSERWSTYPQIFTDKGAFVLKPNYHGSGNHSQAFVESIKNGKYYSLEEVDLYNGIQHLNQQGYVDMDKLGIMGWSNGAILATWMTLQYPDMFKVAAPGAGDVNWTSDYGTCRFGVTFDQSYFGGAPWDDTNGKHYNEWYIKYSPIFEIEKIKTPTIIFHGSEDRSVPRDQGWEYYRGLQQVGKAPVKFLWFPGQPHGLRKITHQLRKMKEEIDWFETYLFKDKKEENEAFKKDSPLASLLSLQKNMSGDGLLGTMENGVLIPSVVATAKDSISIGTHEVSIAQYHAYTGKDYDRLHANMPVTGLSKADIEGYLSWLSEKMGATYRLPNASEAKKWHKKARTSYKNQNNLNHWAGYKLTNLDVADLRSKMGELKVSLIRNGGSHPMLKLKEGVIIYDLGGNVAEYYSDGGNLKTYDYSAYDFVDPASTANKPAPEHTGFRVVKE
ncbi:prolyl oligopeptidase family serine peptidase [Lentiprolixibacter aurantiacus]|uniref:Prolyl oligopeptidase family serine peptidase n=1 Tax=Lentiprolixibacter aurantiacus TaxID=2993939 RepID=A0AAE3SMH1_9FLAO|nr:prolyl oligopeptidase family serine peptidase [Lentiprolixibacter aurantiacus]MCX2718440.1 prolyl oligopeptidase family serine peptidase [Lentiprolixibacter aurantiacus]